jgi:hypothetical protein
MSRHRYILYIPYIVTTEMSRHRYILYIPYIVTTEIQTANVTYFQRKTQLSGFSA